MTLAVHRYLRKHWDKFTWTTTYSHTIECTLAGSECESFCQPKTTSRAFFADILLWWDGELHKSPFRLFGAIEIKPKIYSCGAVLRQWKVQERRLKEWTEWAGGSFVRAVVSSDDPLCQLLADLSGRTILTWDGTRLSSVSPTEEGDQ
jgi:hypothetical protein